MTPATRTTLSIEFGELPSGYEKVEEIEIDARGPVLSVAYPGGVRRRLRGRVVVTKLEEPEVLGGPQLVVPGP
jgi:hypothetical protein